MRAFVFLCVCVYIVYGQEDRMARMPKYDERYDYLDVDALFYSKRLVRNYVDCLINAQRCTPEGKQLKRILPEALRTKCARCTERQKKTAVKVIKRLKYEFPEEWAKLSSRWDPTGDFTRYFEEFLAKEHFNTISGSAGNNEDFGPSALPPTTTPRPVPTTSSPPPSLAPSSTPPPAPPVTTSARPVILNRFGEDGDLMMGSPSSAAVTPAPTTSRPPISPNTYLPPTPPRSFFLRYFHRLLHECIAGQQYRHPARYKAATQASTVASETSTRFPLRPTNDVEPYTTAITLIDQIGYKIIRTTELVTDILKNTVRAVVGR
uniref:Chemosensory protein n=1 Tax=Leucinodes orbonalis TaxID=711050 RepID=A0AAU0QLJ9_9NEOP|nr:chemosensory protein [Leucinodes orbonalis]